jgi:hypothetical protein
MTPSRRCRGDGERDAAPHRRPLVVQELEDDRYDGVGMADDLGLAVLRELAVGEAQALSGRCIRRFLGRLGQLRQHATKVVLP